MKRNFSENSARTTAGCLPVPLFNQKKRCRQPLTSNPLGNESTLGNSDANLDFLTSLTDFAWDPTQPQRMTGTNPAEPPVPPSVLRHQNPPKTPIAAAAAATAAAERTMNNWRLEVNASRANIWGRQSFLALGNGTQGINMPQVANSSECPGGSGLRQQTPTGQPKAPQNTKARGAEQSYPATAPKALAPNARPRDPPLQASSFARKGNPYQQKADEKKAAGTPDGKVTQQKVTAHQSLLKGKDNSLRIISVVIESMKHWSRYSNKMPLLFEMLGVLDSAVTPGQYGAKTFLLRDGEESVPCVFYEIDRELPRLIRGRVHRCVGSYDSRRKVFKCVSVRPATASEQQTFQEFVRISDLEMSKYVKSSNEV